MKITVEHEVPCDRTLEDKCYYAGDFDGNDVCTYHKFRNQTHGPRRPTEYHKPRCTLFGCWLPGNYEKCDACKQAVERKKQEASKKLIDAEAFKNKYACCGWIDGMSVDQFDAFPGVEVK